ncbi:MAG: hypothetical protein ACTSQI_18775, partial [Candidatus Helarchaeota archaeon]
MKITRDSDGRLRQEAPEVNEALIPVLKLEQKLRGVDYTALFQAVQRDVVLPPEAGVASYLAGVRAVEAQLALLRKRKGSRADQERCLDVEVLWAHRKDQRLLYAVVGDYLKRTLGKVAVEAFETLPRSKAVLKQLKAYLYEQVRTVTGAARTRYASALQVVKRAEVRYTKGLLPEIRRTARALAYYKAQSETLQAIREGKRV